VEAKCCILEFQKMQKVKPKTETSFAFFIIRSLLGSMARVKHTPASLKVGMSEIQHLVFFLFFFSLLKTKP